MFVYPPNIRNSSGASSLVTLSLAMQRHVLRKSRDVGNLSVFCAPLLTVHVYYYVTIQTSYGENVGVSTQLSHGWR